MVQPDAFGRRLLRAHVEPRSDELARTRQGLLVRGGCQSEVREHRATVCVDQDVARLDVPVDDRLLVRRLEPVGEVLEEGRDRAVIDSAVLAELSREGQVVGERSTALDELLGDEVGSLDLADAVDRHHGRVPNAAAGVGFAPETFSTLLRQRRLGMQELERYRTIQRELDGLPDHPHSAASDFADQLEGTELAPGAETGARRAEALPQSLEVLDHAAQICLQLRGVLRDEALAVGGRGSSAEVHVRLERFLNREQLRRGAGHDRGFLAVQGNVDARGPGTTRREKRRRRRPLESFPRARGNPAQARIGRFPKTGRVPSRTSQDAAPPNRIPTVPRDPLPNSQTKDSRMEIMRSQGPGAARRGGAMVTSLIAVSVLAAMAGAVLTIHTGHRKEVEAARNRLRAAYLAEAGVAEALAMLYASGFHDTDLPPTFGNPEQPRHCDSGDYWSELVDNGDGTYTVRASGVVNGAERVLEVVVELGQETVYDHAIFAGNSSGDPNYKPATRRSW